jgi:hypothetical protein
VIAPPSLGALPVVPQTGAANAVSNADPFDEVFLLSVLRDELGAEVFDLPLRPSDAGNPVTDAVPAEPAALIPLIVPDGAAGLQTGRLELVASDAAPQTPPADEHQDDVVVVTMPATPAIDLPLLKLAAPVVSREETPESLLTEDAGDAIVPARGADVDPAPVVEEPTQFAGGEGVRVAAKPLPEAARAIWTAPPIVRLDVPSTTWRADAPKTYDTRELLTSKLGEGGAHVVVTHAGVLPAAPSSVTAVAPIAHAALQSPMSATTTTLRADADARVPGENAERIVQSIRLQWARGGGEARIILEPSHLGELTVSLKVDQGVVSVRLQAEAPLVREWLQTQQQTLRQGLAEHQLTLDRLEIAAPDQSHDSGDRDARGSRERDAREFREKRDRRAGRHATFDLDA